MRIGTNPKKSADTVASEFFHQVVIPVFIPNQEDYYTDSLAIFKICLASLAKTSHEKTFVTIVNNGSCQAVSDYLDDLFEKGIVHELIHTENIGKVNASYKGMVGHAFPLVTIADADVLFLEGWQQAVYDIFEAMPKAGAVGTTPLSRNIKYLTANLFFDCFFSRDLKFTPVRNPQAMQQFVDSVRKDKFLRKIHLEKNLAVTKKGITAVVGSGHYVCTYKSDIFPHANFFFTENFMGIKSIYRYIDKPVVKRGYWRVSTEENYTFHMGNKLEKWMQDGHDKPYAKPPFLKPHWKKQKSSVLAYWLKTGIFSKIIYIPFLLRKFLWFKGLGYKDAHHY